MAKDNKSLGRFILEGIPPAPRGVPQIEVTFDIDANGILTVTAKDKATGKEQSIKITGSTGLTTEEIDKLKEEAEKHADEDKQEKERIEIRNKADNIIYTAEKSLSDVGDKAPQHEKEDVEKKVKELKEILDSGTKEEIETKTADLSTALQNIGKYMYEHQSGTEGQNAEEGAGKDSDEEEKKDEEKDKKQKKDGDVEEGEVVN
jgi:molecular chaperone DnaK